MQPLFFRSGVRLTSFSDEGLIRPFSVSGVGLLTAVSPGPAVAGFFSHIQKVRPQTFTGLYDFQLGPQLLFLSASFSPLFDKNICAGPIALLHADGVDASCIVPAIDVVGLGWPFSVLRDVELRKIIRGWMPVMRMNRLFHFFLALATLLQTALAPASAQTAPDVFRVQFTTTAGYFVIEAHRAWSPHGVDRFYDLIEKNYYDNSRFFRVVAHRWVQFGIAGDPKTAQLWRHRTIPDDPLLQHNTFGFVGFANTGPNTRATQVYINLGDNSRNDSADGFAPFGKVVEGMDVVQKLYAGYGESSGSGMRAGKQDKMYEGGNAYLDREFPKLDKLISARIVDEN